MTKRRLMREIDIDEFVGQFAYDLSKSDDFKKKIEQERLDNMTPDEEAATIINLFHHIKN